MTTFERHIPEQHISQLLALLGNEDSRVSRHARYVLVDIGRPAVPALVSVLDSHNPNSRWEAVKALEEIADPAAAPDLIRMLEDEDASVRWAATEALVALHRATLEPLLEALTRKFGSVRLREGAHHVLRQLNKLGQLTPHEVKVLLALEQTAADIRVPWAAEAALEDILYP